MPDDPVSVMPVCVRCQISRPFDSEHGPFADFAIEVGPTPGWPRSRSGDWPAAPNGAHSLAARLVRADFTGMKGRSTMVVSLIMRSYRPRSFANQTGPRRSETSGRPTYLARDSLVRFSFLILIGRFVTLNACVLTICVSSSGLRDDGVPGSGGAGAAFGASGAGAGVFRWPGRCSGKCG